MLPLTEAGRLSGIELSLIRQILQSAPPDAINLALGELGFPLPDILRQHALELLLSATPVYTPNAGLPELRSAIAAYYGIADPGRICVCNGVAEAVFVSLFSLLNPGDCIAVPDPDYPAYVAIANMLQCNVIRLPFESDLLSVDWQRWESLLSRGVRVLVLSHPSNPCGHVFSAQEWAHLTDICQRHHIVSLIDEIYRQLVLDGETPARSGGMESSIVLGGLSKSHCMSGWRLGWILAPPELAPAMIKARQYISTCSNWLSQQLAVYALSPEGMRAVPEVLAQLRACRDLAREHLRKAGERIHWPSASPYLLLNTQGDDIQIAQRLAAKGAICVPGSAFGDTTRGWLRLNYAVPPKQLEQALDIIGHELHLH